MAFQSSNNQQSLEGTLRMGQSMNISALSMSAPKIKYYLLKYKFCVIVLL
jgi:hypothetical protein